MTVVTPRVLVVSESRITRRVVEMTFADQPVELVVAVNGQSGIAAWNARPAAVVLADVAMAAPDGLAIARHVQATAGGRPAAVLLMAGHNDTVDAAAAADADARGVIRKPLDSLQLIDAVREAVRTPRAPRPPQVGGASPAPAAVPAACGPDGHDAGPARLGDADLDRVAARVAALWSGDARHEARVHELVALRSGDLAARSAAAVLERVAPAAAAEAADRLVRQLAPALVQEMARLVVADVSERLVREEIARLRSAHPR
jgi:CheY-like chemotaxis protein